MSRESKRLAWIFVAIVVVGALLYLAVTHRAHEESIHNWENSVHACQRANPKWRAYTLVVGGAQTSTNADVAHKAGLALKLIREQPFVRSDGTTECGKAYPEP
jgi:hypothetical protein